MSNLPAVIEVDRFLANVEQSKRMIAEMQTLEDVVDMRDKAAAFRVYVKAVGAHLETRNVAADIHLRTERRAGEILAELKLHGGDRKSSGHRDHLKVEDLGITHNQSKRWQLASRLPEEAYERLVESCNERGAELSQAAVLKAAKLHVFGKPEPKPVVETPKANLFDLITKARAVIEELIEEFGNEHHVVLTGLLMEYTEILEATTHDDR